MFEVECDSCQTVIEVSREELDALYRSDGYAHCEECDHILAIVEQFTNQDTVKAVSFNLSKDSVTILKQISMTQTIDQVLDRSNKSIKIQLQSYN